MIQKLVEPLISALNCNFPENYKMPIRQYSFPYLKVCPTRP